MGLLKQSRDLRDLLILVLLDVVGSVDFVVDFVRLLARLQIFLLCLERCIVMEVFFEIDV